MLSAISRAKHYVFIDNQFFISATSQEQVLPVNKIAMLILDRCETLLFHVASCSNAYSKNSEGYSQEENLQMHRSASTLPRGNVRILCSLRLAMLTFFPCSYAA
jgi:hypothetical protein